MITLAKKIKRVLSSNKIGFGIFVVLSTMVTVATVALGESGGGSSSTPLCRLPRPETTGTSSAGFELSTKLSQTKMLQHGDGTVVMEFAVKTPAAIGCLARKATDLVVVLDRSGSMAANNKLPYAKSAIRGLVNMLSSEDRFALVSFDNYAVAQSDLVEVTPWQRDHLSSLVSSLNPGGSTNISDGIEKAKALFRQNPSDRIRKIILLSDGEANQGITDPTQLGAIVREFSSSGGVLSSIGMGLGFNETLMSSLSDYGMGNYAYLENLSALDGVLARELNDARNVYAQSSAVEIELSSSVRIQDAAGYPIERQSGANFVRIPTGQLLSGASRNFFITFQAPTSELGEAPLGKISFVYQQNGESKRLEVEKQRAVVATIEQSRKDEAYASIDNELFKRNWTENNYGRVQKALSEAVREGNKEKADQLIGQYQDQARQAASYNKDVKQEVMGALSAKISRLRASAQDAFSGSPAEQKEKQNRVAKSAAYESRSAQRGSY